MIRRSAIARHFILSLALMICLQSVLLADQPLESMLGRSVLRPVPAPAEVNEGVQKLKQLYADGYYRADGKSGSDLDRISLARMLLKSAKETIPDNPGYYPLASEAIRFATLAHKADLAFDAIAQLAKTHSVNTSSLQQEVFKSFTVESINITDVRAASELLRKSIQDAANAQELNNAILMTESGETIAKRILDQELLKAIVDAKERLRILKQQDLEVAAARKTIEDSFDDPAANLLVAKFLWLRSGECEAAEKHAARCGNDVLRQLLVREATPPQEISQVLRLANDWWEFGETQSLVEKLQARELASSRYEMLVGKLAGIDKKLVETRLATVNRKAILSYRPSTTNTIVAPKTKYPVRLDENLAIKKALAQFDHEIELAEESFRIAKAKAASKRMALLQQELKNLKQANDADKVTACEAMIRDLTAAGEEGFRQRPKDVVEFGGHTYALVREPLTWHFAKRRCEMMGGHLAYAKGQEELDFIKKLAGKLKVHLGATDEEQEGEWHWLDGTKWIPKRGEVDNLNKAQHHLAWSGDRLDDDHSDTRMFYICEWDD